MSSEPISNKLRFKEEILRRFTGNATHYGSELSLGILAETASEFVFEKVDQIPPQENNNGL